MSVFFTLSASGGSSLAMCRHVARLSAVSWWGCAGPRAGLIGVKQSSVKKPSEMLRETGSLLLGDFLPALDSPRPHVSPIVSPPHPAATLPLKISHRRFAPICYLPLPLALSWLQTLAIYQTSSSPPQSASPSPDPRPAVVF